MNRPLRDLRELTLTTPGEKLRQQRDMHKNTAALYRNHRQKSATERRRIIFNMMVKMRAPEEAIYLVGQWMHKLKDDEDS